MSTDWHLAIDFGTSNTAAAHTTPANGEVETLPLTHQGNLMPSAVYLDESGSIHVGYSALNHATARPDAFLASPKRAIELDAVNLAGRSIPTKSLVAAVLARVLDTARNQHNGTNPTTLTLTHPEAWSNTAITNLKDGARELGFDDAAVHTLSEPRAAAWYYSRNHPVNDGDHVAVFDFGGGTLDIAVLEAKRGEFNVVSARGDNSLGGRNVDALIDRWVMEQLEEDEPDAAAYFRTASPRARAALAHSIQNAKEILSEASSATITAPTPDGEVNLLLTRDEFNSLLSTDISRAVDLTKATLRDVNSNKDVKVMYLTGGSSRIPYVQDRLGEVGRVARLDDPKTVVARGALFSTLTHTGNAPVEANAAGSANPFASMGAAPATAAAPAAAAATPQQHQPQGPTNFAQPQQAQQFSSVPSSSNSSSSGNKLPLILGGIAAAVLVVGGGIWALNSGGSDGEGTSGTETSVQASADPSSSEASGNETTSAETTTSSQSFGGIAEAGELPADLINRDKAMEALPDKMKERLHSCYMDSRGVIEIWDMSAIAAPNSITSCRTAGAGSDTIYIVTDPDAVAEVKKSAGTPSYSFLQTADAEGVDGAMIHMQFPDDDSIGSSGNWGVIFPGDEVGIFAPFADAPEGKSTYEEYFRANGIM